MTSSEAIDLLVKHFPILLSRVDVKEDLAFAPPYFAYGLLATEVINRSEDREFVREVCKFLNFMAASGDPILEEVLAVSVLERIADESGVVINVRQCLDRGALAVLDCIETEIFGRKTGRPEGADSN
jgi:hypothetical protein